MNKIWKHSSKWRKLPKRVSPLLNVIQALAAIAAVILFLLLFQYRKAESGTVQPRVRYTAYIDEKTHSLAKLSKELDPSEFLHDHPGHLAVPEHIYENGKVKIDLPRPKRTYALSGAAGFKKFQIAQTRRTADPVVMPPEYTRSSAYEENVCIMYDSFGKELARWKSQHSGNLKNTLLKIEGSGILLHSRFVTPSGDDELDKQIQQKASELHLRAGLYSVIHPAKGE
ncbi:MAG: hypothetical protein J6R86_00155 [Lentisphaeria bacterium]|nr:hypothetical protein [Lentisphaeria bacterium]